MTDTPSRHALAEAALKLAAEEGWAKVRLHDLAARAGRPIGDFYPLSAADALDCVEEFFDRAAADALGAPDRAATARDRLFDTAMARFEAMERRRKAVLTLDKAIERDPLAQAAALARTGRTARWLLALAGEDGEGVLARAQAFALVLRRARAAWARDEAGDFAKTMAALDSGLRRAERFFENLEKMTGGLRPGQRRGQAEGEAPREGRQGPIPPG